MRVFTLSQIARPESCRVTNTVVTKSKTSYESGFILDLSVEAKPVNPTRLSAVRARLLVLSSGCLCSAVRS
jgi:hypothetical protein